MAHSQQPVARIALLAVVGSVGFIGVTSQPVTAQPTCTTIRYCLNSSVAVTPPAPRQAPTQSSPVKARPRSGAGAATPSPSPSPTPVGNSAPPASGYFPTLVAPGNYLSLPSDSQCAAEVHYSTWEPRPQNAVQNATMPAPGAMAASFAARPRAQGGSYNSLWDTWLLPRVDGRFTGTTDEILQWAACKWGLPDNLIRADADIESTWFNYLHYPGDASYGGGGGGSCYWLYGCGDAFTASTSASKTYCSSIATQGLLSSEPHDYQKDPVTTAGGYPWTPGPGFCPKTFSILGIMSWDDPAWEAPYPAYAGNQNGTFPFTRDSTAAAADYWGAYIRGCYEGWITWLHSTPGDIWGCMGAWYSGDWYSSAANGYITQVKNDETSLIWLTADWFDASQQYSCDPHYGCAS